MTHGSSGWCKDRMGQTKVKFSAIAKVNLAGQSEGLVGLGNRAGLSSVQARRTAPSVLCGHQQEALCSWLPSLSGALRFYFFRRVPVLQSSLRIFGIKMENSRLLAIFFPYHS